jgi:hypothetical protein
MESPNAPQSGETTPLFLEQESSENDYGTTNSDFDEEIPQDSSKPKHEGT